MRVLLIIDIGSRPSFVPRRNIATNIHIFCQKIYRKVTYWWCRFLLRLMYVTHDFFIMSFAICFNIMSAIELFYLLKKKENLIFTSSIFIVISEILINIQSCIFILYYIYIILSSGRQRWIENCTYVSGSYCLYYCRSNKIIINFNNNREYA